MIDMLEVADEMARLSRLIDQGLAAMRDQARELADSESAYRKAKSDAWMVCPNDPPGTKPADKDWTSAKREAWVNGQTADLRHRRDLADALRQAALEAVRSRRTQVSALQTLLNAEQEEARFARTAPEGVAA